MNNQKPPIKILWLASMFAQIMYLVVGYFLMTQQSLPITINFNNILTVPFFIALFAGLTLVTISYQYLPKLIRKDNKPQVASFQIALSSSMGIFGLILLLLQNNFAQMLILCLLSITFIFKLKPQE